MGSGGGVLGMAVTLVALGLVAENLPKTGFFQGTKQVRRLGTMPYRNLKARHLPPPVPKLF